MVKKPNKALLAIQAIIVIIGLIASIAVLISPEKTPVAVFGSIFCIIVDLYIIFYRLTGYKRAADITFKGLIYVYAALIGFTMMLSLNDIGYSNIARIMIFIFNIVAFANIIKASDYLDKPKIAISYLSVAVALKLAIAISVLISNKIDITGLGIIMALQTPLIGGTILAYYCDKIGE